MGCKLQGYDRVSCFRLYISKRRMSECKHWCKKMINNSLNHISVLHEWILFCHTTIYKSTNDSKEIIRVFYWTKSMSLKLTANLHLNMGWLEGDRFFLGAKASLAGVKLAVSFREFFGFPETNSNSFEHGGSNPQSFGRQAVRTRWDASFLDKSNQQIQPLSWKSKKKLINQLAGLPMGSYEDCIWHREVRSFKI